MTPKIPSPEEADDTGRPRILVPLDIYLDTEAVADDLFTIAFIFSFSTTQAPRSLLLSRGPNEAPGQVWVEPDDPEHGFHASQVNWSTDGLLLNLELADGHTFFWDNSTAITIELMENRVGGVTSCLGQIFAEQIAGITDIAARESSQD